MGCGRLSSPACSMLKERSTLDSFVPKAEALLVVGARAAESLTWPI